MQNYNILERIIHDLLLGNNFIKKSLFELEKKIFLPKKLNFEQEKHVFVTGLPRSGTTVLLNFIYSSEKFESLTYSNMPLILSPNFSKFFKKKSIEKKERYHKDGIYFDLKSPEAFDEVFFSLFDETNIKNELLNFINLVLLQGNKKRYLSKNNLNYKRYKLIHSILPNSLFIIPIRSPLFHSYSLLKQHRNFLNLQKNSNFMRRYMNYLGHNEFGINHIAWNECVYHKNPENINYWIEQWILFYEQIYMNLKNKPYVKFIIYEKLISIDYVSNIKKFLSIKFQNDYKFSCKNPKNIDVDYDKSLYNKSLSIYSKFQNFVN